MVCGWLKGLEVERLIEETFDFENFRGFKRFQKFQRFQEFKRFEEVKFL